MVGNLNFKRPWYFCRRCSKGHSPLDEELEISEIYNATENLIDLVCDFGQMLPFEEASKLLDKRFNITLAASTIQKISENVGHKLYSEEKDEANQLYVNQDSLKNQKVDVKKKGKLYIQCDGSMVSIRGEGWKEVKLGMVFSDLNIVSKNKEKHIINEKDYVAYIGAAEEFKKMLWATAVKNGCLEVEEIVFIGDGAKWIWAMVDELFPTATKILDYYHMSQHVHECGAVLYDDNTTKEAWIKDILGGFNDGKIDDTLLKLDANTYTAGDKRKEIQELKNYLENNKERINYKDFKDKGYFIGSGAIEGGNKCVIQQRFKLAGMHWSKKGAQDIATLRCSSKSNKWKKVRDIIHSKSA